MTEGYLGSLSKWCSKKDRCMRILAALNLIWLAKIFICVAFKAPPPKKKSWGSQTWFGQVPRNPPNVWSYKIHAKHHNPYSENPETLDLSGWCSNHSKSTIQDFKLAGKPGKPVPGQIGGEGWVNQPKMLMDFERRSLKRPACLQSESTIEAGLWKKHRCCRVLNIADRADEHGWTNKNLVDAKNI